MSTNTAQSCLDRLSPRAARGVLAALTLVTAALVGITLSPLKSGFADAPSRGTSDVYLYRAEADRIAACQPYYDAAAAELRQRGYPTSSVFNWRTPLPVWLIGVLPERGLAQGLLGLCGLAVLILGFDLVARERGLRDALACSVLLTGALLPCVLGDLFVMPELWSGMLLALSLVLYGNERRRLAVVAGVAALAMRELAAPYCLICVALAMRERRWRETAWWGAGLIAYAALYAVHLAQVLPRIGPHDVAHAQGWVRFGGAAFVLSTVQMNAYLLLLPQWITAVYFALAMLGFAAWSSEAGKRFAWTAAAYVLAFGSVGQDFNQYWGSMIAPLMAFGAACGTSTAANLARRAAGSSVAVASAVRVDG